MNLRLSRMSLNSVSPHHLVHTSFIWVPLVISYYDAWFMLSCLFLLANFNLLFHWMFFFKKQNKQTDYGVSQIWVQILYLLHTSCVTQTRGIMLLGWIKWIKITINGRKERNTIAEYLLLFPTESRCSVKVYSLPSFLIHLLSPAHGWDSVLPFIQFHSSCSYQMSCFAVGTEDATMNHGPSPSSRVLQFRVR